VQPAGDGFGLADGGGPAGQDEERRLEGVLNVVFAVEDVPANTPDEPAVAAQQGGERGLLALAGEALQELPSLCSACSSAKR
jgi:hypothetical protein